MSNSKGAILKAPRHRVQERGEQLAQSNFGLASAFWVIYNEF